MPDFTVGRRDLYILPTRIGWYYSLILIALFAIAVKFDNQAAFMMLFILTSVGMIAMVYTHNNMIGLGLSAKPGKTVFVGELACFNLTVHNDHNKPRNAVWLMSAGVQQLINVAANQQRSYELKFPTVHRGYLSCEQTTLTSHFPIGVFFCWTRRYNSQQRCLVYPQPLDLVPFPIDGSSSGKQAAKTNIQLGGEDFAGMKSYQPGDRLRDIHWPSLAKTNKLITVQHEAQNSSSINLSWFTLPSMMNIEDRLSQLCYWVIDAEQQGVRYQLEMPSHTIEYDNGLSHYHKCLTVLALWGEERLSEEKSTDEKNSSDKNAQVKNTAAPSKALGATNV